MDRAELVWTEAASRLYLTGGTTASRGCLLHRFSEDLHPFPNDSHHEEVLS